MKRVLAAALAAALLLAACAAPAPHAGPLATRNVIILVLDGPRQSEMWAQPGRPNIPRMDRELRPQGVLYSGFRNNGPTYTTSGHTAACTGFYEDLENSWGRQLPSHAGIFQRFLRASGLGPRAAWVVATKDKLAILSDTRDPDWNGKDRPSLWVGKAGAGLGSGYGEDADTRAAALAILGREHPRLMLINLKQPDAAGHAKDWEGYLRGIRDGDAFAADLWAFLQKDPSYRGRTALFVTHDHGRHLDGNRDGFVSHGDDCEGCRRVALLALGPDFRRGVEYAQGGELIDVAATAARLLGFGLPGSPGKVLEGLFEPDRVPAAGP